MKHSIYILLVAICCMFVGCDDKKVSDQKADEIAVIAKDNSVRNAKLYIALDPRVSTWGVIPNGDSSITAACPTGDGWATITLVAPDNVQTRKLKCSTNSIAKGCLLEEEFKKKTEFSDGSCNSKMPEIRKLVE